MDTVNLSPGDHDIEMSLAGYALFKATIRVSSTGGITCVSVMNGNCNSPRAPGMLVSGTFVTGYLKESAENICSWVSGKGGPNNIKAFDIMTMVRAYTGQEDIGVEVKSADIMGAVAYYSGNKNSGNQLTGCSF